MKKAKKSDAKLLREYNAVLDEERAAFARVAAVIAKMDTPALIAAKSKYAAAARRGGIDVTATETLRLVTVELERRGASVTNILASWRALESPRPRRRK